MIKVMGLNPGLSLFHLKKQVLLWNYPGCLFCHYCNMRRLTLRWHLYIEQGEVSYSSLYFCAPQEKNSDKTDIGEETFEVISVLSKVINSLEFCAFAQ